MRGQERTMTEKIKVRTLEDLREPLRGALGFERGEAIDLRVTGLPYAHLRCVRGTSAKSGSRLMRAKVLFARFLNVSKKTVRSREQGTRRPRGADLKLLSIAKKNPQALLSA